MRIDLNEHERVRVHIAVLVLSIFANSHGPFDTFQILPVGAGRSECEGLMHHGGPGQA